MTEKKAARPVSDEGHFTASTLPMPIIVGARRSGTTLLRAMLDSHPDLAIPPESYFLVGLAKPRGISRRSPRFDLESFVDSLFEHARFRLWGLEAERTRLSLYQACPVSFTDAFRVVYGEYAHERGKRRYGDKTPWYVDHIGFLSRLFPEARFVHVIRDGRDVALSQGSGEIEGALTWRRAIRRGRKAGVSLEASQYVEVRYEDLVRSPDETLRSVCHFLDLPFHASMLRYTGRADEIRAGFRRAGSVAHRRLSESPRLREDDWTTRMTPAQAARFEELARCELVECGYPLSGFKLRPWEAGLTRASAQMLSFRSLAQRASKAVAIG